MEILDQESSDLCKTKDDPDDHPKRITADARQAIQEMAEQYMSTIFNHAGHIMMHADRVTIQQKDMQVVIKLRNANTENALPTLKRSWVERAGLSTRVRKGIGKAKQSDRHIDPKEAAGARRKRSKRLKTSDHDGGEGPSSSGGKDNNEGSEDLGNGSDKGDDDGDGSEYGRDGSEEIGGEERKGEERKGEKSRGKGSGDEESGGEESRSEGSGEEVGSRIAALRRDKWPPQRGKCSRGNRGAGGRGGKAATPSRRGRTTG
jgi:histone H3/H4